MIRSALVKFARSERARTRCFVETCQRGVFANSVVTSPPQAGEGADRVCRLSGGSKSDFRGCALHRLEQHGAALAAADAFGGDALAHAEPLHRVDEMQHDAVAARADGMAET